MAWMDPAQTRYGSDALSNIQIVQPTIPQPVTLFQQPPFALASPMPSLRPGHIREDLVELMMMQNAQMHQVIMNNMTMSALRSFGYTHTSEQQVSAAMESEEDPEVYHHHYPCAPCLSSPGWLPQFLSVPQGEVLLPQTIQSFQDPPNPPEAVRTDHRDRIAEAPPTLPSGTGPVRAQIPPADCSK